MKNRIIPFVGLMVACLFVGCLVTPVGRPHSLSSVTIPNTNEMEILAAAQQVFAEYGYSPGPMDASGNLSFEKPATGFSRAMWGGYLDQTTIRVVLDVSAIPGGNDYVVRPRLFAVRDGDVAGFTDQQRLSSLWALEFKPLMEKIRNQAQNTN